jgi:hypothetical protein
LYPLSSTCLKKTGYDVLETRPKNLVSELTIPAYFMVSENDVISPPEKLRKMFSKYGKKVETQTKDSSEPVVVEKIFRLFDGEHNSMRS